MSRKQDLFNTAAELGIKIVSAKESRALKIKPLKASTLSVIMRGATSVHCYLEVNGESCNVSLRFDKGPKAMICGYPQPWIIHDVGVDAYDFESPTGAEMFEAEAIQDGVTYISAETETLILKKLKACVARQFRSKDWAESCPKREQIQILKKIERAIKAVDNE